MDAERWQRSERVFHVALQAAPSRRATILENSCAGDEPLRRETESLLAHHKNPEAFIETPALAPANPGAISQQLSSTTGGAAPFAAGAVIPQYAVLHEVRAARNK